MAINHVSVVQVHVIHAHELAALAVLPHRDETAVGIGNLSELTSRLNHGVRVTANHQVDIVAVADNHRVVWLRGIVGVVTDVRHHHRIVAAQRLLEIARRSIGHVNGANITQPRVIFVGNQALRFNVDAKHTHTLVAHGLDIVRLKNLVQLGSAEVVVGTQFLGLDVLVKMINAVQAIVKLVVAEDNHVVAQRVHEGILHLAAIEREERGALHSVACMHGERVLVVAAHLVEDGTTTQQTALAIASGVNLTVSVVGGYEHKMFGLNTDYGAHQQGAQQEAISKDFFHRNVDFC